MTLKNEIILGLPFRSYQAIPAQNMSLLKEILDSPGALERKRNTPQDPDDVTPAKIRGSGIDCKALEPELFYEQHTLAPMYQGELPAHFVPVPPEHIGKSGGLLVAGKEWLAAQGSGAVPVKPADWSGHGLKMNTDAGRAWRAHAESMDLRVLSYTELHLITDAAQSVLDYELTWAFIDAGVAQVTLVWQDADTGIWCKGRPDLYIESASRELVDLLHEAATPEAAQHIPPVGAPIIPDLKSTGKKVDPESLAGLCFNGGWHRSQAHYCMGAETITGRPHDHAAILAVEQDAPHRAEAFVMPGSVLEQGRDSVRGMLDKYAYWDARGEWPSSSGKLLSFEFKPWMSR